MTDKDFLEEVAACIYDKDCYYDADENNKDVARAQAQDVIETLQKHYVLVPKISAMKRPKDAKIITI